MPREPKQSDAPWWLRLLPSPTPRPADRRVSIWSIQARDAQTFFCVASLLWLVALIQVGYKLRSQLLLDGAADGAQGWRGLGDFALATLSEFSGVATGIAVVAMLATRPLNLAGGILMSLYQAMVNRFVIPVIEEHRAEGRAEGIEQGRAIGLEEGRTAGLKEGRAEVQTKWRAWNQRRLDAERQGREFVEPPPG